MIDFDSFSDELQKIAAPRWKQLLRAGELGAQQVKKLRKLRVRDPVVERLQQPGMVRERAKYRASPSAYRMYAQAATGKTPRTALDYSREVAGMERGSEALAKKHGIKIIEGDPWWAKQRAGEALEAVKARRISEAVGKAREAVREAVGGAAMATGGGMALPGKRVLLSPDYNVIAMGTTGRSRRAVEALTKRHEIYEQIEGARQKARGARKGWLVHKEPSNMVEEAIAANPYFRATKAAVTAGPAAVAGGSGLVSAAAKRAPAALRPVAQRVGRAAETVQRYARTSYVPRGRIQAGQHFTPGVISRESAHIPMMPPAAQQTFKALRTPAEGKMLKPFGFQYGIQQPRAVQQRVMKAFEARQV